MINYAKKIKKFRLLERFNRVNTLDVKLNKSSDLSVSKSEYEVMNGLYKRKGIINGKPYWFKNAQETYDEDVGYHIHLADSRKNRWVISNGCTIIYECIANRIGE